MLLREDYYATHIITQMCIYVHVRCAECTTRRFLRFVLLATPIEAQTAQSL